MSKAFTSEDSGGAPELLRTRRRTEGPKRPITRAGHAAWLKERAELEVEHQKLIAHGAEVSALDAGLRREELTRRLGELEILLDEVVVTDPPARAERVAFDTEVTLRPEANPSATLRYHLVGPDEADPRAQRLSVESPLARALLGKQPGDEVTVELPRGTVSYEVLSVS